MTSPFIQQIADNRVCQVLTCLPEKFVVDFANGIDVAQEHIRTAGERTFFRRLKEGLTGEGAARQNAINASLAQGVEASLRWLTEMTTSLATTNYAITRVNDRVSSLVSDTARLAHYSADTGADARSCKYGTTCEITDKKGKGLPESGKGEALEIPHSPEKEPVSCLTDWHYTACGGVFPVWCY